MESKTLTAYEKIDVVLKHFLWEYYDKREVFNNISGDFWIQLATKHNENPIENKQYILIADQLVREGYVIKINQDDYQITYLGEILVSEGGYHAMIQRKKESQINHEKLEKRMVEYTYWLMVGSFAVAVLGLLTFLKQLDLV